MASVSVIVPNYNHAAFLPARLESVLGQTHADFELLVMDDKSPDDSLSVIARYLSDPRARLVANEVNSGGPYRQWQKGLGLTSGDYVWFAESDDVADPTLLATLIAQLDAHPSAGIAMCLPRKIDGAGAYQGDYFGRWDQQPFATYGPAPFRDGVLFMKGRDYLARYMTPFNTLPNASGMLFRRAAFEAVGGPVADMKICGDWFTYCKMLAQFDIVIVPDTLNHFRTHVTNVRKRTKASDFIREAFEVRGWVADLLGSAPSAPAQAAADQLYAQLLIQAERSGPRNRVPLRRVPAIVKAASEFGSGVVAATARGLAREIVGGLRARISPRSAG